MRTLFVALFLTLIANNVWGDIIFLKNGSQIRGKIIEISPETSCKIKSFDGSIFVFKMENIDKIIFENLDKTPTYPTAKTAEEIKLSIVPFAGVYRNNYLNAKDKFIGIGLRRLLTKKKQMVQWDFASWEHKEKIKGIAAKASFKVINTTGLFFFKFSKTPLLVPCLYLGPGIGFYFWDAKLESSGAELSNSDVGIGCHLHIGTEILLLEFLSLGLEVRYVYAGKTFDWEWNLSGVAVNGNIVFNF
jgi:hypothetical protein